jgi:hypothetical protein
MMMIWVIMAFLVRRTKNQSTEQGCLQLHLTDKEIYSQGLKGQKFRNKQRLSLAKYKQSSQFTITLRAEIKPFQDSSTIGLILSFEQTFQLYIKRSTSTSTDYKLGLSYLGNQKEIDIPIFENSLTKKIFIFFEISEENLKLTAAVLNPKLSEEGNELRKELKVAKIEFEIFDQSSMINLYSGQKLSFLGCDELFECLDSADSSSCAECDLPPAKGIFGEINAYPFVFEFDKVIEGGGMLEWDFEAFGSVKNNGGGVVAKWEDYLWFFLRKVGIRYTCGVEDESL